MILIINLSTKFSTPQIANQLESLPRKYSFKRTCICHKT